MKFPGDLTGEELEAAYQQLRERSVERWGEQRTAEIERDLRNTAAAIARLERLRFSRDDAPAFYLHETTARPGSDSSHATEAAP